jgi:hypothetical protein
VEWALFDGELPNTKEWMQLCFDKLRMTHFMFFEHKQSYRILNVANECILNYTMSSV